MSRCAINFFTSLFFLASYTYFTSQTDAAHLYFQKKKTTQASSIWQAEVCTGRHVNEGPVHPPARAGRPEEPNKRDRPTTTSEPRPRTTRTAASACSVCAPNLDARPHSPFRLN
jgi:hypothetical protein